MMWQILLMAIGSFIVTVSVVQGIDYVRHRPYLTPVDSLDVEGLLRSKKLWQAFKSAQITCAGCGDVISFENLGTISEDESTGQVELVCRNPVCLGKYIDLLEAEIWKTSEDAS